MFGRGEHGEWTPFALIMGPQQHQTNSWGKAPQHPANPISRGAKNLLSFKPNSRGTTLFSVPQTPSPEEQISCCPTYPTIEGQPPSMSCKPHLPRNIYLVVLHNQLPRDNPPQRHVNPISQGTKTLLSCVPNYQRTTSLHFGCLFKISKDVPRGVCPPLTSIRSWLVGPVMAPRTGNLGNFIQVPPRNSWGELNICPCSHIWAS